MEKGPVSLNLVARVKAHPLYDARPMVKELLESIIATQPEDIQAQTSKIVAQHSQDFLSSPGSKSPTKKEAPKARNRAELEQRPWNSIEVGFEEDALEQPEKVADTPKPSQPAAEEAESGSEYSDSELEELAEEVEQVETTVPAPAAPVVEVITEAAPPDPITSDQAAAAAAAPATTNPQFLDAFDRGLAKRQSKGKYQHMMANLYGRGLMIDFEDDFLPRRRFAGSTPDRHLSPLLFDKAKKYIMRYPNVPQEESDDEDDPKKSMKKKEQWRGIAAHSHSPSPPRGCAGSVPPRTPPLLKSDTEEGESSEEEHEEPPPKVVSKPSFVPATTRKEVPTATNGRLAHALPAGARKSSFTHTAPASVDASPASSGTAVEATTPKAVGGKYIVTVAELKSNNVTPAAPPAKAEPPKPKVEQQPPAKTNGFASQHPANATTAEPLPKPKEYNPMHLNATPRVAVEPTSPTSPTAPPAAAAPAAAASAPRRVAYTRRAVSSTAGDTADLVAHYLGTVSALGIPSALTSAPLASGRSFATHRRRDSTPLEKEASIVTTAPEAEQDPAANPEAGPPGKQSWESAAAYIRRKNRERRIRNRTIGDPEDVLRALSGADLSGDTRNEYAAVSSHTSNYMPSTYSDRRGARDYSPERDYGYGSSRAAGSTPTSSRKFDDDSSRAPWNINRFEVYRTRAERNRDEGSSYSRGTLYPGTTSTYSSSTAYQPSSYVPRSPYDNAASGGYTTGLARRNFDSNPSPAATRNYHEALPGSTAEQDSRRSAVPRRVHSALSEQDRRNYARSRSTDRARVELDFLNGGSSGVRSRLVTPELSAVSELPSGGYTSYASSYRAPSHERDSMPRDEKPRGILKNKNEPEPSSGASGVRGVIERLRRHLSLEKTQSPPPSYGAESSKKKRSSIDMNRRKTSELRLGADGINTIGYSDASGYKRASPQRETSKGLSWRSAEPSADYSSYVPSVSRYDGSSYSTSSKLSAPSSRDNAYVPQYRKFPGSSSANRDTTALNRYSYTPGATQRYTWYDDPNIY